MATKKTGAAFTVRFLRNGDQVFLTRNIIYANGSGAALFQFIEPNNGTIAPDWSVAENQPIIVLAARSAAGYPVEIKGVTWAYNGTTLKFTLNSTEWVTATNDSRFMARINESGGYELKIAGNLATTDDVGNKQITYEVEYICNGMTDKTQGSADVLIQISGSSSHILRIGATAVELSENTPEITLTGIASQGGDSIAIGQNGYSIEWYQDNKLLNGQTSASLTVTRAMVTGGSVFVAKLKKTDSEKVNVVAQDGIRIGDISDEYQIGYKATEAGSNYVGIGHNAVFTLILKKNGVVLDTTPSYAWTIYNEIGDVVKEGTGATVTIEPSCCLVGSGDTAYYADCDVQVTAELAES